MSAGRPARSLATLAALTAALFALGACGASLPGGGGDAAPTPSHHSAPGTTKAPAGDDGQAVDAAPVAIRTNVPKGATGVAVDKVVTVKADGGTLSDVAVTSKQGAVAGSLDADGTTWTADKLLEPGTTYTVKAKGVGADGTATTRTSSFTTQALTLDQQTYPSVSPLAGQTVGVGMPVVVHFDVPVSDKAAFEKHMTVTSQPAQKGSWYWVSGNEAHWRPRTYWKAGTKVQVHIDVNSVPAGNGIYGQTDRDIDFTVGDAHIYKVDMKTDQMKVYSNGKLIRTLPVTTGKTGFTTRSGTKVIEQMTPSMEMSSATIGIPVNSPNGYDIKGVLWDMRLTNSGEFIHAAPWSEGDQGSSNVSHGCTGLSTADAEWLYKMSRVGDVVVETGTSKPMEFTNGYGDWNKSWADYQKGSAL